MQQGSISIFLIFFFIVQMVFTFFSLYLLRKWSAFYKSKHFSLFYLISSLASFVIIVFTKKLPFYSESNGAMFLEYLGLFSHMLVVFFAFMSVILVLFHSCRYIFRLFFKKSQDEIIDDTTNVISRRSFLKKSIIFLPFISLIISIKGIFVGNSEIVLNKVKAKIQGLPSNLNNFKIVQFSDVHLGAYFKMDKLEKIINMVKEEKPDLLVITGDLVDDESLLPEVLKRIEAFAATLSYKAYFCYGNHEYFRNFKLIINEFNKCPSINVLKNESDTIFYNDVAVNILGVDYPFYSRHNIISEEDKYKLRESFLEKAQKTVNKKGLNILLTHHSDFLENAFNNKIDLTFAGHTHGGQISLFNKVLLPISFKYMRGSYLENGCFGYVSTGAGHWFPCRLNCPAEVTIFTLTT